MDLGMSPIIQGFQEGIRIAFLVFFQGRHLLEAILSYIHPTLKYSAKLPLLFIDFCSIYVY